MFHNLSSLIKFHVFYWTPLISFLVSQKCVKEDTYLVVWQYPPYKRFKPVPYLLTLYLPPVSETCLFHISEKPWFATVTLEQPKTMSE